MALTPTLTSDDIAATVKETVDRVLRERLDSHGTAFAPGRGNLNSTNLLVAGTTLFLVIIGWFITRDLVKIDAIDSAVKNIELQIGRLPTQDAFDKLPEQVIDRAGRDARFRENVLQGFPKDIARLETAVQTLEASVKTAGDLSVESSREYATARQAFAALTSRVEGFSVELSKHSVADLAGNVEVLSTEVSNHKTAIDDHGRAIAELTNVGLQTVDKVDVLDEKVIKIESGWMLDRAKENFEQQR